MSSQFVPLEFKPDMAEAVARWDAYLAGTIIDRPLVRVVAPKRSGAEIWSRRWYHDRAFAPIDGLLDQALARAADTYFGGEAMPVFDPSLGPDAIAAFCGGDLSWSEETEDTNWAVPFIEDWEQVLPLQLDELHPCGSGSWPSWNGRRSACRGRCSSVPWTCTPTWICSLRHRGRSSYASTSWSARK